MEAAGQPFLDVFLSTAQLAGGWEYLPLRLALSLDEVTWQGGLVAQADQAGAKEGHLRLYT